MEIGSLDVEDIVGGGDKPDDETITCHTCGALLRAEFSACRLHAEWHVRHGDWQLPPWRR